MNPPQESKRLRKKISELHAHQFSRQGCLNHQLSTKECEAVCELGSAEEAFLNQALTRLKLSARAFHRLLKVARTIADMDDHKVVTRDHLGQAMSYKNTIRRL